MRGNIKTDWDIYTPGKQTELHGLPMPKGQIPDVQEGDIG